MLVGEVEKRGQRIEREAINTTALDDRDRAVSRPRLSAGSHVKIRVAH